MEDRKIKFRGIWIQDGTWVHGFYYQLWNSRTERFDHYIKHWRVIDGEMQGRYFVVKSNSICQWTGLVDKSGKEIYEGDLVKVSKPNSYLHGTFEVRWHPIGMWAYFSKKDDEGEFMLKGNYQPYLVGQKDCTVIGNIFEESETESNEHK